MKLVYKTLAIIIILSLISTLIIAANIPKKLAIPVAVQNLENTTELFEGVYISIKTDKTNYSFGEKIPIELTITNHNTEPVNLFSFGYLNLTSKEFIPRFDFNIYNYAYKITYFNHTFANTTTTIRYPPGIFTSYNYTLNPKEKIIVNYQWNQIKEAFYPPEEYGKPVEPGTYYIVGEQAIDWRGYYGILFPFRHFGAQTIITINE